MVTTVRIWVELDPKPDAATTVGSYKLWHLLQGSPETDATMGDGGMYS